MSSKGRKFNVVKGRPPNSDINVTPLVDVVLVLLIIFMVVTPLLEKDIEVKVPTTEQVEETDEIPEGQIVISITAEGDLQINSEKVADADFPERLRKNLNAKAEKLVFFMADDRTNYGRPVTALDYAKRAGASTIGMMTENPDADAQGSGPAAKPK